MLYLGKIMHTFCALKTQPKLPFCPFNSLAAIDGHDHQFFDKLLWGLVTSMIFVCC